MQDQLKNPFLLAEICEKYFHGSLSKYKHPISNHIELQGNFDAAAIGGDGLFMNQATLAVSIYPMEQNETSIFLIINDITKQNQLLDMEIKARFKNKVSFYNTSINHRSSIPSPMSFGHH